MARFTNRLDNVRVAVPCPANWDSMYGNERVRFCGECQLNVYNLSEMSRAEAEKLIGQAEGRLCVRYYRRRDGSIITQNCPVGLRALKRRLSRIASAVATSVLSFFAGIAFYEKTAPRPMMGTIAIDVYQPIPPSVQVTPPVTLPAPDQVLMGKAVVGRLAPIKISRPSAGKPRSAR